MRWKKLCLTNVVKSVENKKFGNNVSFLNPEIEIPPIEFVFIKYPYGHKNHQVVGNLYFFLPGKDQGIETWGECRIAG